MPETFEIEIPDFITEYLAPIPGNSAIGIDLKTDPDYFKLTMEIPKTLPDYRNWIELSGILLKEKSKDLRVASWLVLALYRTENVKGLKNGLTLLLQLLKKFGNDLYPTGAAPKSKAIQFISTDRVTKLLEKETVNRTNMEDFSEAGKLLSDLENECEKLFPENKPVLKSLTEVIKSHIESASSARKVPEKPETKIIENNKTESVTPVKQTPPVIVQSIPPQFSTSSEKDAVAQLRKILSFFYEYQEDGARKQRVPENYFVFSIARQIQWSNLNRPADIGGVTLIEAPNKIIQGLVKDWFTKSSFDILISRVESEFIKENSEFRYWLDGQRYLVQSLENKGGVYVNAAVDIKQSLSKLLLKIPDLPQLKFKDKQTPFADEDTLKWLGDDVKNLASTNGASGPHIPSIVAEDYKIINEEYEQISNEPPENFEKNISRFQKDISSDDRIKGKFLRRLNLANYFLQYKEYQLAKINLIELTETINVFNLAQWEEALCTAVWKTLYLTNREIISHTKDGEIKTKLEKEQEELFHHIAKYDGVLAIKLIKQKK